VKGQFKNAPGSNHEPPAHLDLYWHPPRSKISIKVGELHDGIAEIYEGMPQAAIDAFIVKGTEIADS
jgi:hypothetical protein